MKNILGKLISFILFELACFSVNNACVLMLYQPEEENIVKELNLYKD